MFGLPGWWERNVKRPAAGLEFEGPRQRLPDRDGREMGGVVPPQHDAQSQRAARES